MLTDKKEVIYLDAAASALKPQFVIDAQLDFLQNHYANAGRGICARAEYAERMVAAARESVAGFIGAKPEQIVFTSGATDGLNRIPRILESSGALNPDSLVMVSDLDHHSARLPWEELARGSKCKLGLCELDGDLNLDFHAKKKADIFVITAMSNVMGVAQDVKQQIKRARDANPNVITIVDAAQYIAHSTAYALDWDCDFLCFSGHKIGADTGIGVMYIKEPDRWHPDKLGGGMVSRVSNHEWAYAFGPAKFEAGTLPLTQIAGLSVALKEVVDRRSQSEGKIKFLRGELAKISRIRFVSSEDAALLTFTIDGMHAYDFGVLMGAHGVCLRVGNMCASWLHARLGLEATVRISTGPWNTMEEMEQVVGIIKKVIK